MVFLHAGINTGLSRTKKVVHAREPETANSEPARSPDTVQSPLGFSSSPYSNIGTPSEGNSPLTFRSSPGSASPKAIGTLGRSPSPESPRFLPTQVDNSHAMTQQYISHWITICRNGGLPWISSLPSLLTPTNPSSFAIERCVLAASLGYHGKLVNSKSVMMEAYKWYGFGLRKQRSQLEHFHPETRKPSLEEICMPIMLAMFEIVCGTGLAPYFQHVMGAARMLEIRGPAACGRKELQSIFRTVRTQMVCTFPHSPAPNTDLDVDICCNIPSRAIISRSAGMAYNPIRGKRKTRDR
jgi:hypothetical protein